LPPKIDYLFNIAQNVIFKFLQSGQRISVWLFDNLEFKLEGKIIVSLYRQGLHALVYAIRERYTLLTVAWPFQCRLQGFDEFMNVVLDDAEEVWLAKPATEKRAATEPTRKPLGKLSKRVDDCNLDGILHFV